MDNEHRRIEFDIVVTGISKLKGEIQSIQDAFGKLKNQNAINSNISEQLKEDLLKANSIVSQHVTSINDGLSKVGDTGNNGMGKLFESYKRSLSDLTLQAEKYHRLFQETGNQDYFNKYQNIVPVIQQLDREHKSFSNSLGLANKNASLLERTLGNLKHHAGYLVSGAILGAGIGIPYAAVTTLADLEQQYSQLMTTMPQMHENQYSYNQVVKESLALAQKYGTEINNVTDSLRLVSRQYKDTEKALFLSEIAVKLSVADNFSPEIANKYIESSVSAFQQQGNAINFATHAMDAATAVSHNAQISAQDLAEAHMRSAAAAHAVGVSYDELNALIGTITKNSGLSGATVGQGVKSILNSLHSTKAEEEFQKLGISIYNIGEDGTKSFKKLSDLLMETMVKIPMVKTNLEEAFRDMSSGKFQVSKFAALMGDPNEYIRLLGVSINSSGMTDKQIVYQLDTITRKAERLKVSLESLVMTGGQAGGIAYIKSWLDDINNLIKGLQQVPTEVYSIVGSMVKWSIILYAVKSGLTFLSGSMVSLNALKAANVVTTTAETAALTAEGAAAARTAGSMGVLGAATATATGGLSLLMAGIIAAGTATAIYAANVGESVSAQDQAEQKTKDMISVKQQEIDQNKRQVEHIGTLGSVYEQLKSQLASVGTDEEARVKLLGIMGTTESELAKIVGEAGVERIKSSEDIQTTITQEQEIHSQKSVEIQSSLNELKTTQRKLADDTITFCNERVGAINNEAVAFDKACSAIGEALGSIEEMMFKYHRNKASWLKDMAGTLDSEREQFKDMPWYAQIGWGQVEGDLSAGGMGNTADLLKQAEESNAKAEKIKNDAVSFYANKGGTAASLAGLYTPGAGGARVGGDEVPEPDAKKAKSKSGSGTKDAPDKTQELFRLEKGREVDALFKDLKRSSEDYQGALDKLNTKQDIFGVSADITAQKVGTMNSYIMDLIAKGMEMESLASEYEDQAQSLVSTNETLVAALAERKAAWSSLSKQEKQEFVSSYKDYVQDEKTLLKLVDLADNLRTKVSEIRKDATKAANDTVKVTASDAMSAYELNMRKIGYNQQNETYGLGRFATPNQTKVVEYKYAVQELAEAEKRLKQIQDSPHSDEDFLKQQAAVNQLKQKAEELGDTFYEIRSGYASVVSDIVVQNQSLGQIWKKQWNDLANDAIKALFKIKNSTPGLLSQLLGLSGGKGGSSSSGYGFNFTSLLTPFTGHATGGIFDTEHIARFAEGNKKEAIIPLEDNRDRGRQLWQQSGKELGMLGADGLTKYATDKLGYNPELMKGEQYAPYFKNEALATQPVVNVHVQQQESQNQHLIEANKLMVQQNQMLLAMLNKEGGNGNVTVIPMAPTAESVSKILSQNPEIITNLLYREKSLNRWS